VTAHLDRPPGGDELRVAGERIEALLRGSAADGVAAGARAEELVGLVTDLYGSGLSRLLDILGEFGVLDARLQDALAADALVSGLLLVHDLHPHDVRSRVTRALDSVRPYLGSHGGDVELVEVSDSGVVRLRMRGSCDGCPSSSVTLQLAVEGAIEAAAPEVSRIEVESGSPAVAKPASTGSVFSVDSLLSRVDRSENTRSAAWVNLGRLADLANGELAGFELDAGPVCVCRIGDGLFCFRDRCPHCSASLAGGVVERRPGDPIGSGVLRCPQCRSHFDVRRAGACVEYPGEHLDPLPLLVDGDSVSIAVPAAAS
jgi:Fe-S cluster biogenesis protein NfuA/nitrite reductase/ring-hydroxylating ferredoxin subunit